MDIIEKKAPKKSKRELKMKTPKDVTKRSKWRHRMKGRTGKKFIKFCRKMSVDVKELKLNLKLKAK